MIISSPAFYLKIRGISTEAKNRVFKDAQCTKDWVLAFQQKAKSLMDNIGEKGTLGVLKTMSPSDDLTKPQGTSSLSQPSGKFSPSPCPRPFSMRRALLPDKTI